MNKEKSCHPYYQKSGSLFFNHIFLNVARAIIKNLNTKTVLHISDQIQEHPIYVHSSSLLYIFVLFIYDAANSNQNLLFFKQVNVWNNFFLRAYVFRREKMSTCWTEKHVALAIHRLKSLGVANHSEMWYTRRKKKQETFYSMMGKLEKLRRDWLAADRSLSKTNKGFIDRLAHLMKNHGKDGMNLFQNTTFKFMFNSL